MTQARRTKRRSQLQATYGLTEEDYEAMDEVQGHACAICDGQDDRVREDGTPYPLSVDHDHSTNRIRGLLCHRCNTALGLFKEDLNALRRAVEYLGLHAGKR